MTHHQLDAREEEARALKLKSFWNTDPGSNLRFFWFLTIYA